jgi:hypothetical protein
MNRIELVLLFAALFVLILVGLRLGWRNRANSQADLPPLPEPPADLGPDRAPPLAGLYVGTTLSTRWQDRVVVHTLGQQAAAVAHLGSTGVLIEREGTEPVFIPAQALCDARLEPALAGKVVGAGGLLVLRWQHGDRLLDTGLRGDDKTRYPDWVTAVAALVSGGSENSGFSSEGQGIIADE